MQKRFNLNIKHSTLILLTLFCAFLFHTHASCSLKNSRTEIAFNKQGTITITNSLDNEIVFDIEIADNVWSQAQGLMFRYKLDPHQGMFFIFENEDYRTFWMKNTYLSLDIIFIDADFYIVDIFENAFPLSEETILSKLPAKYTLEILGGRSKSLGITIGDLVFFERDYSISR